MCLLESFFFSEIINNQYPELLLFWKFSHFMSGTHLLFRFPTRFILLAGCQWLMTAILATQETEIKRIVVQSQPGHNSS
jgi:hypothetical protein